MDKDPQTRLLNVARKLFDETHLRRRKSRYEAECDNRVIDSAVSCIIARWMRKVGRGKILSPIEVVDLSEKALKAYGYTSWHKSIRGSLFQASDSIMAYANRAGLVDGLPACHRDDQRYRTVTSFWWKYDEHMRGASTRRQLSGIEFEIAMLLTLMGDENAIGHCKDRNFWRRATVNPSNNRKHPRRRVGRFAGDGDGS